mmetsp:Transcript_38067/g.65037  ORF Transcript_38067/g.65037 Transcript_38067/m.65037 type:complete len:259 (-) Transcript_38067:300-1076(-)
MMPGRTDGLSPLTGRASPNSENGNTPLENGTPTLTTRASKPRRMLDSTASPLQWARLSTAPTRRTLSSNIPSNMSKRLIAAEPTSNSFPAVINSSPPSSVAIPPTASCLAQTFADLPTSAPTSSSTTTRRMTISSSRRMLTARTTNSLTFTPSSSVPTTPSRSSWTTSPSDRASSMRSLISFPRRRLRILISPSLTTGLMRGKLWIPRMSSLKDMMTFLPRSLIRMRRNPMTGMMRMMASGSPRWWITRTSRDLGARK